MMLAGIVLMLCGGFLLFLDGPVRKTCLKQTDDRNMLTDL